jgi:hypothetical protein
MSTTRQDSSTLLLNTETCRELQQKKGGEGKENIKLYIDGVTTPVTNSFIQCKSVHKASCIRAPGKKRRRRRG